MKTKFCSKCHKRKNIIEFHKDKNRKYRRHAYCKECRQTFNMKTRNKLRKINKKICCHCKQILPLNAFSNDKLSLDSKTFICKKCKYYVDKKYRLTNKENIRKKKKEYKIKNRTKISLHSKNYNKKKYKINLNFRLLNILRSRIYLALKEKHKSLSTIKLIGCSVKKLRKYLEKQFKRGMTWGNYGLYSWHIDHIKPCASFDLSKVNEQQKCFNYKNLQPLWAKENLSKGKS